MMQNRTYIGVITGGIATGKSTVCDMLREKGFKVVDSDKIVHGMYETDACVINEI